MPPPPRPRNSASVRPSATTPMSERQQIKLLQMSSSTSNDELPSSPNSQSNRAKDRNERGETPLHIAAKKGDFDLTKKLLEQGTNPNVTDFAGWTPLHESANHGHYHVAQILIKHGANIMSTGLEDMTPLHDAAAVGNQKLVKLLIEKGADPNFKNKKGQTPQDIAHASLVNFFRSISEMANNKQQKKTEVKKPNPDEIESSGGVVATSSSSSSTQAVTSDVYEFVSTPKHSSCSSGDENPIKSFDKCSDHEKSETDSDTLMTAANASLNLQQQKRTLGDQQDRSEDNLSPADDDSKRKKRKDSEFAPSSSTTSTNSTVCKEGKSSGINRVTSRVGQKPPGPASKTMGLIGKSNDKSPCESPKLSKSPAETSEADNDDATKSSTDSNPKVPPLKIVIPQQTQQTQQLQTTASQNQTNSNEAQDQQTTNNLKTANKTPRNISSSSSTLPYVLNASSNSNDSISNDKTETLVLNAAGRSQSPTESNKSNNEDGKQTTGSKSKEPRVLRSSQRSGKDSKDDRSSNNSSPQLPVSSTPSPAAQNSGDSSSAGTESEVTSTAVITSQNIPNQMTSSSNSSSLLNQQQTQNQQQQAASSSSLHTSVDLHPRKRKIKVSSSCKEPTPSSSSSSSTSLTVTSSSTIDTKDSNSKDGSEKAQGSDHPHDQPYSNCYQMYIDLRKQIDQRHKNLHPIEPRPLKGLEDYLMNRRTYSLQGKTPMELNIIIPPLLPNQMKDTFCEQEKERHKLKMRHIVEKEKLVLSKEQEILRVHCKAAQMIANQAVPFSCCTILKDEEIYNIITPEQEEKYRNKNRERSHGRVFYQALKELDDKWDRIKEAMIIRHTNEAESLHACQNMNWGWKLKEFLLCDSHKVTPEIEEIHVPMVDVSDEYTTPSTTD